MSVMPPDPVQQNGGPPAQAPGTGLPDFDRLITKMGDAIGAAAQIGSTSKDQDAILKCAQAGNQWAQAITALMPPKPDPAATVKAQADMLKAGSQQAHDAHQAELQREHDVTNLAVQASKATSQPDQGGNNDG
jgi:hypothetical protein